MSDLEKVYIDLLQKYVLSYEQMVSYGYPVIADDQSVIICKNGKDVNCSNHSANPIYYPDTSGQMKMEVPMQYKRGQDLSRLSNTNCCRCGVRFHITDKQYLKLSEPKSKCRYHWGKLQLLNSPDDPKLVEEMFTCCRGKLPTQGCTEAPVHVWDGLQPGINKMENFVCTEQRSTPPSNGNYGVYAVDCEMCYTVRGLELTKVTVVGMDRSLVYESYVKPDTPILDYNTRFSGVSANDFIRNTAKTLKVVQNDLLSFINADTILIGHGLENDLRALKMVHFRVVDTSHTFPHPKGLPYRWSLKILSRAILKRNIQCSEDGHNNYEDAFVCMELIMWQLRQEIEDM